MVNTAGVISTIVGKYPGSNTPATAGALGDGGPATSAQLSTPEDVEVDANGNLFIADQGNSRVRVVYAGGAQVAALIAATNGGAVAVAGKYLHDPGRGHGDLFARQHCPWNQRGGCRLLERLRWMRAEISISQTTATTSSGTKTALPDTCVSSPVPLAQTSGAAGCSGQANALGDNCQATLATLNPNSAMGVGVDGQGNVYISDSLNARIRKVSLNQSFPTVNSGSSKTQTLVVHFAVGDTPAATSPSPLPAAPTLSSLRRQVACERGQHDRLHHHRHLLADQARRWISQH